MRRNKTRSLAEVIGEYVSEMNIERKLKEVSVVESWENLVGKVITSKTTSVRFRNGKLHVQLKSSVIRNELLMLRESLRAKLNEKAGEEIVKEIVIR
jgi:predicted nucleic acid-binding Zn ribbon protein